MIWTFFLHRSNFLLDFVFDLRQEIVYLKSNEFIGPVQTPKWFLEVLKERNYFFLKKDEERLELEKNLFNDFRRIFFDFFYAPDIGFMSFLSNEFAEYKIYHDKNWPSFSFTYSFLYSSFFESYTSVLNKDVTGLIESNLDPLITDKNLERISVGFNKSYLKKISLTKSYDHKYFKYVNDEDFSFLTHLFFF